MQDHIEVDGVRYVREESVVLSVDTEHRGSQNQMGVMCPYCGDSSGLHFDEVWLENAAGQKLTALAEGEDDRSRLTVSLTNDGHSERRHTLTIVGECEHCGHFSLRLLQHKGATFLTKSRSE